MSEPTTSDSRISYLAASGGLRVFDRVASCALCERCLLDRTGHCPCGGPFPNDEGGRYEVTYFEPRQKARLVYCWVGTSSEALAVAMAIVPTHAYPDVRDRQTPAPSLKA